MKLFSLNSAVLALVLVAVVVPAGAVTGDELFPTDEPSLVAAPHDGPNGEYAELQGGNLSVDLASVGVNPNATTAVDDVFDLTNEGDEALLVWLTHDATEHVTVVDGAGDAVGSSEEAVRLDPGETLTVGFLVDTRGAQPGDQLLDELTVRAREPGTTPTPTPTPSPTPTESPATPTPTSGQGGTGGTGGTGGGGDARTPTATPTPVEGPVDGVAVEFTVAVENATVEVIELDALPTEDTSLLRPEARIQSRLGGRDATGIEGVDALVMTNETITLDGYGSLVGTADAVDEQVRVSRIVDIEPPATARDTPATVRIRVDRAELGDADATEVRVGRATGGGWQLLETRVVDRSPESVTFAAETHGFSTFAVFADPDVTYSWDIEGVGGRTGPTTNVSFATPGVYNASLTVTDAFGQSDTARYRILANDRPNVTLDAPEPIVAGQPVTLGANVSDELGETTVEWRFEDGTSLVGPSVNRSFEPGRHVVEITVRDEYGATRTREFVVRVVTPQGQSMGVRTEGGLSELWLVAAGTVLLLLSAGALARREYSRERAPNRTPLVRRVASRLGLPVGERTRDRPSTERR